MLECPHWSAERSALAHEIGPENLRLEELFKHVPALAKYIANTIFHKEARSDDEEQSELAREESKSD